MSERGFEPGKELPMSPTLRGRLGGMAVILSKDESQLELKDEGLLRELEPVVESELNRHLAIVGPDSWNPHDFIQWDKGRNFTKQDGEDWRPEDSHLDRAAQVAMLVNLLTEDNLPGYHHAIATFFGKDGAWGRWVGQWTAEEAKHSIVLRDYLLTTRGIDPVQLEQERMSHMIEGYDAGDRTPLEALVYVTFQELATRVSHRNTGAKSGDPIAESIMTRIAKDENRHMLFYRNIVTAALEIAPNQTVEAITKEVVNFKMPGASMNDFRRRAMVIAEAEIYNLPLHYEKIIMPTLERWEVFSMVGLDERGQKARDELVAFLETLKQKANRFTDQLETKKARQAERNN